MADRLRAANTKTWGDIMRIVESIDNETDAQDFMAEYRKVNKYADENIGYASGYCSDETAARIQKLFKVTHPIFGDKRPTAAEAFAEGQKLGGALASS